MADAVQAFGTAPVLSSALLAVTIGVSIRTALTLLGEMTELGLLQENTGRRTARIWAVPSLGARLAARPWRGSNRRPRALLPTDKESGTADRRSRDPQAIERAFSDLDTALAQASALLIGTHRWK